MNLCTDSAICQPRWTLTVQSIVAASCWMLFQVWLPPTEAQADDALAYFHQQVEPILRKHCYACHSHAAGVMENGLALDWKSGWKQGGTRGPAIVPGSPAQSLLIKAIEHADPELKMPENKLADAEIATLLQWVRAGAADDRVLKPKPTDAADQRDWWSLKPLVSPPAPQNLATHPIDAFIQQRLEQQGLALSNETDKATLLRRLTYDLTGLPPTPEELSSFVADHSFNAYDKVLDRLLASPRYGERWARHWMDTIHFAESHGFEHDLARDHAWHYRDWLIEALNDDLAWQQFIQEQLAADVFCPQQPRRWRALGFLGAGPFDLSAYSTAPISFEYVDRDDLVTQTMAAFSSTTANCARCHAHKFDPISQDDYYALQATFAGITKGNIAIDEEPIVAQQRQVWTDVQNAVIANNRSVLLSPEHGSLIDQWLAQRGEPADWTVLEPQTFLSSDGASLERSPEGAIISQGTRPERDTYSVSSMVPISQITALRLEVLSDERLPKGGPGRQDNGNLHLTELEVFLFEPGAKQSQQLKLQQAQADFNQAGWGIERAFDGKLDTAWGIFPAVGQSHTAVFSFPDPIVASPGATLLIRLKQLHGGGHLIGKFRLAVTADDPRRAAPLTSRRGSRTGDYGYRTDRRPQAGDRGLGSPTTGRVRSGSITTSHQRLCGGSQCGYPCR